jgi:hypothetical protein
VTSKMFWLDGSSTLPFPIVSTRFLQKPCVESLAEALASVENQAKIAKSWVEIGNFNHWCQAASQLVDLTYHLVAMDNDFLYYEGSISYNERLRCCSKLSSQLVDLVSFLMFECARECLLENFKFPIPPVTTSLDTHHNLSANKRPSPASAETGAEVTTTSPALPCHTAVSPQTTTTTSHLTHPPLPNEMTGTEASPCTPRHAPAPSRSSSSTTTTTAVTSHSHEQQSNGCLAPSARIPQEEEVNMEEKRKEEKGEQRGEERQEQEGRATPSKPPTPSPLTTKREQEPPVSPRPRRQ